MLELLNESTLPANIVYTTMLAFSVLYMFVVILGALDVSAIDFDIDLDADVDMDVDIDVDADMDMDADTDASGHHGPGIFAAILSFFNLGKLPFMIIFTICSICMWSFGLLSNHYLGGGDILFSVMMFIPNLFVSLTITKVLTTPLVPVFKSMNQGAAPTEYVGATAILTLPIAPGENSQAEVNFEGDMHLITVRLDKHVKSKHPRGTQATITGKGDGFYWINPS